MKKPSLIVLVIVLSTGLFHGFAAQAQPCAPGPGAKCTGADFSGRNMDRIVFASAQLDHARFENTSLKGAQFMGTLLRRSNFAGADLSGANLQAAQLGEAVLSANLTGASLVGAQMQKVILAFAKIDKTDMRGVNLEGSNLAGVNLLGADLTGANLTNVNLKGAKIDPARLANANLSGTTMPDGSVCAKGSHGRCLPSQLNGCQLQPGTRCAGMNLANAQLGGIDLSGSLFAGANLDGANFDGANLSGATLEKASLKGASFKGALLVKTIFSSAPLAGADFSRANLGGAWFVKTDLTGLKFTGASLAGANFQSGKLSGAELRDAATIAGLKFVSMEGPEGALQEFQAVASTPYGTHAQAIKELQDFMDPRRQLAYQAMRFKSPAEIEKFVTTDYCHYLVNYQVLVDKKLWQGTNVSRGDAVSACAAIFYKSYLDQHVIPQMGDLAKANPGYAAGTVTPSPEYKSLSDLHRFLVPRTPSAIK